MIFGICLIREAYGVKSISSLYFSSLIIIIGLRMSTPATLQAKLAEFEREHEFLRRLIVPEEDRAKYTTAKWTGEYQLTLDSVLDEMIARCRELRLRAAHRRQGRDRRQLPRVVVESRPRVDVAVAELDDVSGEVGRHLVNAGHHLVTLVARQLAEPLPALLVAIVTQFAPSSVRAGS